MPAALDVWATGLLIILPALIRESMLVKCSQWEGIIPAGQDTLGVTQPTPGNTFLPGYPPCDMFTRSAREATGELQCIPGSVGKSDDPNCVVAVDENTILVCAGMGGLKRTTDGGRYDYTTLAAASSLQPNYLLMSALQHMDNCTRRGKS